MQNGGSTKIADCAGCHQNLRVDFRSTFNERLLGLGCGALAGRLVDQGGNVVADRAEGATPQVPQFGKIVLLSQTFAGMANRQLGHVVVDAVVRHQRAHGAAQIVQAEIDAAGPLQLGD